jgi:hypothetical protein
LVIDGVEAELADGDPEEEDAVGDAHFGGGDG